MKNRYYIVVLLFLLIGCGDFLKEIHIRDKNFSMKTIPYTGNEIKIDGYYINDLDNGLSRVYIFYANGVRFGGSEVITTNDIEVKLKASDFTKRYGDNRACWGPYEINNNKLMLEFYANRGNMWCTCIAHCEILNDTTFNIEKITFCRTGEEDKNGIKGIFNFKQFSPKPDSTNNFIK